MLAELAVIERVAKIAPNAAKGPSSWPLPGACLGVCGGSAVIGAGPSGSKGAAAARGAFQTLVEAKIGTGAGGGGFLLVICPPERQRAVRESLPGLREFPVGLDHLGSRVVLNVLRDIWR